jgi:hypothetical protein
MTTTNALLSNFPNRHIHLSGGQRVGKEFLTKPATHADCNIAAAAAAAVVIGSFSEAAFELRHFRTRISIERVTLQTTKIRSGQEEGCPKFGYAGSPPE